MPQVSDLKLKLQTGTDSTYFATWDFKESAKKPSGGSSTSTIKKDDWVTVKSGATYYNGSHIPNWVYDNKWKVIQVTQGDRAVLGPSQNGKYNIQSAISTKYLTTGSSSGSTSGSSSSEDIKYLDHYLVKWYYATGDGIWFISNESGSEVKVKQATYSAPSNATKIKVTVKPVSKTYKVNDDEVSYWEGTWVKQTLVRAGDPPEAPGTPSVTIDDYYKLTAKVENISDGKTDQIQFEIYSGNTRVNVGTVAVKTQRASFTCSILAGEDYRARCRAINIYDNTKIYSEWSQYSSSVGTIPNPTGAISDLKALSETSVYLAWRAVKNATSYSIEYATKRIYFDSSSEVKTATSNTNHAEITGLGSGQEYFFRVRAVNDAGESAWSKIRSIIIGKAPAPPTTWSSTTTAIVGEDVILYWAHNSEDGSSQTYAELELYIGDAETPTETYTIENSQGEDEKDKISQWILKTNSYTEGTVIKWRVRTAGITEVFDKDGWSILREINVYAPPTLQLSMEDKDGNAIETLTSFPFYVKGLAGPNTQAPIGYHVSIVANEQYETLDNIGNDKMVNAGEEVYSKYFDITKPLTLQFTPSIVDLQNGIEYTVICTVSMNSGLTTESNVVFNVRWAEVSYEPDAEIGIDTETYSAYVSPYCLDINGNAITDVSLSVYRREFDGSFTELATGVETDANEYILDPHPSLDYARYRIVAVSKTTGAISYYDPPGYPVGGKSVIIQWDDKWSNFDATEEDELEAPPWSGSMLKLPYNIDVTDNHSPDISLVEYIGRSHPVSYYGTQLGASATWNMEVPKDDKDTLYALRRLSRWMGDVYVREPSGSGYWASITVSFNQKHLKLTIPVTLNISQVEGGI